MNNIRIANTDKKNETNKMNKQTETPTKIKIKKPRICNIFMFLKTNKAMRFQMLYQTNMLYFISQMKK